MSGGHSVLQIPVPQLEPFVIERHRHYDAGFVSSDPRFVHAHITALGPFLPPDLIDAEVRAAIGEIARGVGEFAFRLARVDTFPNGIIHLVPEPEDPFRALTRNLVEEFPQCPPYAGEFPDVRPHLTLDARSPAVTVESTRQLLGDLVPASCVAARLDLAWYEAGDCRVLRSWPLRSWPLRDGPARASEPVGSLSGRRP